MMGGRAGCDGLREAPIERCAAGCIRSIVVRVSFSVVATHEAAYGDCRSAYAKRSRLRRCLHSAIRRKSDSVYKAHACGNDFLIVESLHVDPRARGGKRRRALCARNTGVGADGVEYFEWTGERSGTIVLYNADGSIAEISGNGTRCVAAWMAHSKGVEAGESVLNPDRRGRRASADHRGGGFSLPDCVAHGCSLRWREHTVMVRIGEGSRQRGFNRQSSLRNLCGQPRFVVDGRRGSILAMRFVIMRIFRIRRMWSL